MVNYIRELKNELKYIGSISEEYLNTYSVEGDEVHIIFNQDYLYASIFNYKVRNHIDYLSEDFGDLDFKVKAIIRLFDEDVNIECYLASKYAKNLFSHTASDTLSNANNKQEKCEIISNRLLNELNTLYNLLSDLDIDQFKEIMKK